MRSVIRGCVADHSSVNMPELAIFAEAMTPFDNDVFSLGKRTSKAEAFFFGLSAQTDWIAVWETLLDPMLTAVIHDVFDITHVENLSIWYVVAGEASVIDVAVLKLDDVLDEKAWRD